MPIAALGLLLGIAGVGRADQLGTGSVVVRPGAARAVVPVRLGSAEDLTLLGFTIAFDPLLCAQLVDPNAIVVRKAGRTAADPWEEPIACGGGRISVGLADVQGATVVPAGDGAVLEIDLGAVKPNAGGTFWLGFSDVRARRGSIVRSPTLGTSRLTICTACCG